MCDEKTCRTCCAGVADDLADRTCGNKDSENFGDWVGDDSTCDNWAGNCLPNFPFEYVTDERIDQITDELRIKFQGMGLGEAIEDLEGEIDRRSAGQPPATDLERYTRTELCEVVCSLTGRR